MGAARVDVRRMDVALEAAVPRDFLLALPDPGVEELLSTPCLKRWSGRDTASRRAWYGSGLVDPLCDRRGVLL